MRALKLQRQRCSLVRGAMAPFDFSRIIGRQEPCAQVSSHTRGRFRVLKPHALTDDCIANWGAADVKLQPRPIATMARGLVLCLLLAAGEARLAPASTQLHKPTTLSKVSKGGATKKRPASEQLTPSETLCGNQPVRRVHDNSSRSHVAAMTQPSWLCRAVRNRHHHAIEQASRRWRR